jgi:hypothetical protein
MKWRGLSSEVIAEEIFIYKMLLIRKGGFDELSSGQFVPYRLSVYREV